MKALDTNIIVRFLIQDDDTDLSDALIGHCAHESGCEVVLTFDKKAARSDFFESLTK